jgi:hypothetical protein
LLRHAFNEKSSIIRRQTGTFMQVHPGAPGDLGGSYPQSSGLTPDEQPTERSHLGIASTCKLRAQTLFLSGLKACYTTDHLSA